MGIQPHRLGLRRVPFSFQPTGGDAPTGFTNVICLKVVDAIKTKRGLSSLEVRYTTLASTNRIPRLTNGTVDLDCATTTNTVQRQQQEAFAPSHFMTSITAAVKMKSEINSLVELGGNPKASCTASTPSQFKEPVDKTATDLMKSGAIEQIYTKWFTKPIPPNNVNLNFPMSDAVRDLYKNPNNKGV